MLNDLLGNGDIYRRKNTSADAYQCGCHWERRVDFGDVLVQCQLHQAHTDALVREFDRKRGIEVPNSCIEPRSGPEESSNG